MARPPDCPHQRVEIRRRRFGQYVQYRPQCQVCGAALGESFEPRQVSKPGQVPAWNLRLPRSGALRTRGESARRQNYARYLRSRRWEFLRRLALERDRYTCRRCGDPDAHEVEVHHQTYERFEDERLTDLITLCTRCHRDLGRPS